jgi:hypothetical protein
VIKHALAYAAGYLADTEHISVRPEWSLYLVSGPLLLQFCDDRGSLRMCLGHGKRVVQKPINHRGKLGGDFVFAHYEFVASIPFNTSEVKPLYARLNRVPQALVCEKANRSFLTAVALIRCRNFLSHTKSMPVSGNRILQRIKTTANGEQITKRHVQ